MITIILIFCGCWILYKAGFIKKLLNGCRMDPGPDPAPTPPPENRAKWEAEARYVLTKQGLIDPNTVKYMGDEMLINIIREYLDL